MLQVFYHGGKLGLEWSEILGVRLDQVSPWWVGWLGLPTRWQLVIFTHGAPLAWTLDYGPALVNYHRVLRGKEAARAGQASDVVLV